MSDGLIVSGLSARYRHGPTVLHEVDFAAPRGAVTALVGPNGSGKSTLLKSVLGLVSATGRVALDGVDLATLDARAKARRVAYVPQRTQLTSRLPVHGVVAQGRFAHRGPLERLRDADRTAVADALRQVDLEHVAERPFHELSGGEAQRVLLARALATEADVVLLDEPTSALDVRHALELQTVLQGITERGRSVVACLHDLSEVRNTADRVVLLQDGRVRASGSPEAIVADAYVREVYGVELVEGGGLGYRLGAARRTSVRASAGEGESR